MKIRAVGAFAALLACTAAFPAGAEGSSVRAGAAMEDITPGPSTLGPTDIVRDPMFVRAIFVENGSDCAVLVGIDHIGLPDAVTTGAIARAEQATGCPADNIIVSATHTHSYGTGAARSQQGDHAEIERAIAIAIERAKSDLRSARVGFASTDVHLNVNRDLFSSGRWTQKSNPAGPSDKTLAVLAFVDEDNRPIGAYLNYAMHPINFYMSGVVSADFPGEASRYVERQYGGAMVAIFAQGASGDQNPLLVRPQNRLSRIRTAVPGAADLRIAPPAKEDPAIMGQRIRALGQPVPADALADYQAAVDEVGALVAAEGALLGESAVDMMQNGLTGLTDSAVIRGSHQIVSCPGRDRQDMANPIREGGLPPYADGSPVSLRVGLLRIADFYISSINAEIYTEIGQRLKREAPVQKLLITTLANGSANSGYVYSDSAKDNLTFPVIGSRLKPGCAENAIIDASLKMIAQMN